MPAQMDVTLAGMPEPHARLGFSGQTEQYVWVRNLTGHRSRFKHEPTGAVYKFEAAGFVGSLIEMPVQIAVDPFVQRNIQRGILDFVGADEAMSALPGLAVREELEVDYLDSLQADMAEGVSEQTDLRFRADIRDRLPDQAEARRTTTSDQIIERMRAERERPARQPRSKVADASTLGDVEAKP